MTEAAKHTPGPWKVAQTEPPGDYVIHAKGIPWQLAYVPASTQIEWPLEANARLIAAAPDLLEALKELRSVGNEMRAGKAARAKADAAIARATGA